MSSVTVRLHQGKDRQWYLTLTAANGQALAHSEGYRTKWNAKRAARKNFAGIPLIIDIAYQPAVKSRLYREHLLTPAWRERVAHMRDIAQERCE